MGQVNLDSLGLALSVIVIFIINCDLGESEHFIYCVGVFLRHALG